MAECSKIWDVLLDYEAASGQKINKEKTSLFFSKNTNDATQEEIKDLFGAQIIRQHERYLGLPSLVGKGKKKAFNRIKDQLGRKIAGWKGKLLSKAGKETLIKAVAQATPTYTMSCFKLPDSLCQELSSMISNFWWGQKANERKISWVAWDKMCNPKAVGGLGFRDLKAFNLALLAKQGWRLLLNTNSLLHQVFKAKYFAEGSFLDAQLGSKPSFAWRSILAAKSVLIDGLRWSIGDGESVHIWNDKWLPTPETFKVMSPRRFIDGREHVSALIDREKGCWRSELIKELFLPHEANSILAIPLTQMQVPDSMVWTATANGVFSVRSAYHVSRKALMLMGGGECSDNSKMKLIWKTIWKLKCPNKIKNFIWRACKDILPTNVNLRKRKIPAPIDCDICGGVESAGHVFWSCEVAAAVWEMSNLKIPRIEFIPQGFLDLFWLVMEAKPAQDLDAFATTAWFLWNNRNCVRHGGQCKPAFKILEDSKQYLEEFRGVSELPLPRQPRPLKSWCPPQIGWYKVNIDGAVFKDIGHCGIGVVVRNDKGLIMGALCKNFPFPLGALEVEAKAAEVGVIFAWELGLREIILEGDSQVVIQAISDPSLAPTSVQRLIVGVKSGLASFSSSKVVFTHRECNNAAHLLARHARQISDCTIWVEDTPPMIVSQILSDVSGLGFSPV